MQSIKSMITSIRLNTIFYYITVIFSISYFFPAILLSTPVTYSFNDVWIMRLSSDTEAGSTGGSRGSGLGYGLWHWPCMGQPWQPPPQEPQEPPQICLPAFLSRINRRTIKATAARRTSTTSTDARLACSQVNIHNSSFQLFHDFRQSMSGTSVPRLLLPVAWPTPSASA